MLGMKVVSCYYQFNGGLVVEGVRVGDIGLDIDDMIRQF